jgi:uncharacterized protein YtpQ (UPF0354 family)
LTIASAPRRAEDIVPLIKLDIGPARPGEASGLNATDLAIFEPLAGDLLVTYAFDLPNAFALVQPDDLRRLNISREMLRTLAVGNLAGRVTRLECREPKPHLRMLTCGGNFEASLLLFDQLWPQLAQQVDGELVAAVPARDVLVFTGSRSPDGLKALTECVANLHADPNLDHGLSRRLFARKDGAWKAVRLRDAS